MGERQNRATARPRDPATRRRGRAGRGWPVLLLLLALAGCGEGEAVRLCGALLPALVASPEALEIGAAARSKSGGETTILLPYRRQAAAGPAAGRIACRFVATEGPRRDLRLVAVEAEPYGEIAGPRLALLLRTVGLRPEAHLADAAPPRPPWTPALHAAYFLQQSINGLTLGCVYALIAVGYTLVYGISGIINFAYGEIYMIGAFLGILLLLVLPAFGAPAGLLAIFLVLALTMVLTAPFGQAMERLVFRPMRGASPVTPLIAAVGLAILLQEAVRLLQGADVLWLQPPPAAGRVLFAADGFAVHVNGAQLLILLGATALAGGLWFLQARTATGRMQRACAEDRVMAAMLGVDVGRTVALTFAAGAALAGAAGVAVALYYGGVTFFMGYLVGFKALTAALLGGIGSLPGALLGGLLIALAETFWSAYLDIQYKDLAVFAVLVLVLVFRPAGLLGGPTRELRDRI